MEQNLYGGTVRQPLFHIETASQPEDAPRHLFTFLDGDPTYPIEFGPLWVALEGFKVLMVLIYIEFGVDF
jgi:hypothetical protein